ncbi:MAG: COX15/CtaA family protein [Polyangiaceae bacterium]
MTSPRLAKFAWGVLAYNVLVILWGAFVRASGSGAGCGAHWPMCNGVVMPVNPRIETLIELSHRVTSGLSLLLVVVLAVFAFRVERPGSPVRRAAFASVVFIMFEALIGAGLVLFELVAHNASVKRALSMSLHLTNTFFLLAALSLTAWWASGNPRVTFRRQGPIPWIFGLTMLAMIVLGTSGAITALGDTLFPVHSLSEGFAQELSATAHLFVRLKILHPFLALGVALGMIACATTSRLLRPTASVQRLSRMLIVIYLAQLSAGLLNVTLLAPIWLQLVHLALAEGIWICLVLLGASALHAPIMSKNGPAPMSERPPSTSSVAPVM